MALRMQIVWDVLEMAKDNNDAFVIAACRRCIVAYRLGRKFEAADWSAISALA